METTLKENTPHRRKIIYIDRYNKENYVQLPLSLRKEDDKFIINYLKTKPSRNGYIKQLIIEDMKRQFEQALHRRTESK